ncbi:TIGR02444 family protein [Emcibacter sp. SYSU 3D8]|uniref:TIGR02444 family protein n=1 Tax=Emcibacter sp. SYSU 3D8 TaxID=3133969 RepID=UPI0031FF0283
MSPAGTFWCFSLSVYGAPGVEAACLDLQDRFGADVNLVLYCLWIGRALTPQALDAALEAAAPIQTYIQPLRDMRRSLPKDDGGARDAVKRAELAAEKLEQDALEALGEGAAPDANLARLNLRLYAGRLAADADAFAAAAAPLLAATSVA